LGAISGRFLSVNIVQYFLQSTEELIDGLLRLPPDQVSVGFEARVGIGKHFVGAEIHGIDFSNRIPGLNMPLFFRVGIHN
jgi:hypothetical protein